MITSDQIRAARTLLHLDQSDLARRAGVSLATLRRAESATAKAKPSPRAIGGIQHALEAAGAEFIENGVRRRRQRTPEEQEALFRKIMDIAERGAKLAAENPGYSDSDLYDENGLPA